MKSIFNLVCLAIVILASHYASANQNEFKINAEIIDYDPSKKIISLDGAISMTSDDFQISGRTATISMNEEVISIEGNPARINLENPEKIFGEAKQIKYTPVCIQEVSGSIPLSSTNIFKIVNMKADNNE
jgi:lipopolysaccharide export system protein LptA